MNENTSLRWKDGFLRRGDTFNTFWKSYLNSDSRDILFVTGLGFDPRMCSGIEQLIRFDGEGNRDSYLLLYNEGDDSPSHRYREEIEKNHSHIRKLFDKRGIITEKHIKMFSEDEDRRRIGSRSVLSVFSDDGKELTEYSDIIIDISSIPRLLYFPLIGKILYLYDHPDIKSKANIHIFVTENPNLDVNIEMEGIDERANYIHGLQGGVDKEANSSIPGIWLPILGEKRAVHLNRINTLVNPEEICPILPFPSKNPRRGDSLLMEYREFLFDSLSIEPENIIYVCEQNPFDTYRKIIRTAVQYNNTLSHMGGCRVILSALSSKLLSLGVLMAAYDLMTSSSDKYPKATGIAHIEAQGYNFPPSPSKEEELFSIWLAGDCYE